VSYLVDLDMMPSLSLTESESSWRSFGGRRPLQRDCPQALNRRFSGRQRARVDERLGQGLESLSIAPCVSTYSAHTDWLAAMTSRFVRAPIV